MNFPELRKEICDGIESALARYWSNPLLPELQPKSGGRRQGVNLYPSHRVQRRRIPYANPRDRWRFVDDAARRGATLSSE
jgi:hypothetical protein